MTVKSRIALSSLVLLLGLGVGATDGIASSQSVVQNGSVEVQDSGTSTPVDPEFPGNEVDPGPSPSTDGPLRIDFISTLAFGHQEIATGEHQYKSLAQLFHSDTQARGYYVQITDVRGDSAGWELQLSQDTQFQNQVIQEANEQSLTGAVLSFDKGWANSFGVSDTPQVFRETIAIQEIGAAYSVASATSNQGKGIWTIEFGASAENESNQVNTLSPLTDEAGEPVIDETFRKQAYENSAITLSIPDTTKLYPVQYTTSLTWTLTAGPTE